MIFEVTEPKEKAQDADRSSDEDDHTPLMMIDDHSMTYNASFYNEDTTTQLASPSTKKNQNQNEKKRSQSKKKRKAVFERVINKDGTGFRIKNSKASSAPHSFAFTANSCLNSRKNKIYFPFTCSTPSYLSAESAHALISSPVQILERCFSHPSLSLYVGL